MKAKTVTRKENEPRAAYLLRVAGEYIETYCDDEEIVYDDARWSGDNLASDCKAEAEILAETRDLYASG